jgi:hypothetical protein
MRVGIKISRELYLKALDDLRRPHEFAYERVGFLTAKHGNRSGGHQLVLLTDYHPVPDNQYIDDPGSGARINSAAIREAMQRVLDTGDGAFHIHLHDHRGKPGFGEMDQEEIPRVVSGLRVAGPDAPHGMLLFSGNHAAAWVWLPRLSKPVTVSRISVVGFPMAFFDQE